MRSNQRYVVDPSTDDDDDTDTSSDHLGPREDQAAMPAIPHVVTTPIGASAPHAYPAPRRSVLLYDQASSDSRRQPRLLMSPLDSASNSSFAGVNMNHSYNPGSDGGRTEGTYTPGSTCYMMPSPSDGDLTGMTPMGPSFHHGSFSSTQGSVLQTPVMRGHSHLLVRSPSFAQSGYNPDPIWEQGARRRSLSSEAIGMSPVDASVCTPAHGTYHPGDTIIATPPLFFQTTGIRDSTRPQRSRASTNVFDETGVLGLDLETAVQQHDLPAGTVPESLVHLTQFHSTLTTSNHHNEDEGDQPLPRAGSSEVQGSNTDVLPGALAETPPSEAITLAPPMATAALRTTNRGLGVGGSVGAARSRAGSFEEELSPQALAEFTAATGGADDDLGGHGAIMPFTLTPTSLVIAPQPAHIAENFRMSESIVASQYTNDGEDAPRWIPMSRAGSQVGDIYDCADLENFLKNCEGSMYNIRQDVLLDCLLLKLPIEILRYIIDYYLAICHHNSLRSVSKVFNMLVTTNCSLWHRRLPFVFEQDSLEDELNRCRLYSVIQGIHEGEIPMIRLATTYCFQRCCHDVWQRNKIMFHERVEKEKLEFEELAWASYVFQGMMFPSAGSTGLGIFLMVLTFVLFLSFNFLIFISLQPVYVAFLPLWCFFALCYPLMYLFFCHSCVEPLVLSIINSIGVNLTAILVYFYRTVAEHAAMSWISCLTPTLLCIACCATYIFLVCHRWVKSSGSSNTVVGLSVATATTPILLLFFLLLFGAEADHALVVPESQRRHTTLAPSATTAAPTGDNAGQTPSPFADTDPTVQGTVRLSGLFLCAFTSIFVANLVYAIRRANFQDLWKEERTTTVVMLGYVSSGVVLVVLSIMIFINVQGLVLFTTFVSSLSLFFVSSILNIVMKKNNFGFHIQLFPLNEGYE